jgi:uncharacterized protein (DUF1800 family)
MPVSRRTLLQTGAAVTAVSMIPASEQVVESALASSLPNATTETLPPTSPAAIPPPEAIAMHRMAFGPRSGDIARVKAMGVDAYVDEQLNPTAIDDSACEALINQAQLKVRYTVAASGGNPEYSVHELRPLSLLNAPISTLWPLRSHLVSTERLRPYNEVLVATWIRAVHSKRQLFELMVDFWHNHFNVSAPSENPIAATFSIYDRLIRQHALGNFRTFVEEVGKSVAMMYALDNVQNKAGGGEAGNENYARELIELHTLGSDNYLKFYDDRRQIQTITYGNEQFVQGYIDDDVYEAASCFTAWAISSTTGEFAIVGNHDTGSKTVLSLTGYPNIPSEQDPIKDGKDVYDLVANHIGTARFICKKLCRRFIADDPPNNVVEAAVAVWMQHRNSPDQIKRVMKVILTSTEFKTTWGKKIKRPFESTAALLRATNATLPVDEIDPSTTSTSIGANWEGFWSVYNPMGQRLFNWPSPTGHPDVASYWANTNAMLNRWRLFQVIRTTSGGRILTDYMAQTDLTKSCVQIVDYWIDRLFGYTINPKTRQVVIDFLAQGFDPNEPPRLLKGSPDSSDP